MIGVIADCGIYGTVDTWSSYQVYENLCLSSTVLFLVIGIGEGIGENYEKSAWQISLNFTCNEFYIKFYTRNCICQVR